MQTPDTMRYTCVRLFLISCLDINQDKIDIDRFLYLEVTFLEPKSTPGVYVTYSVSSV